MWNVFNVNNKNIFRTYFTSCSSVSFVNFEHVIVYWVQIIWGDPMAFIKMLNTFQSDIKRSYSSIFLSFWNAWYTSFFYIWQVRCFFLPLTLPVLCISKICIKIKINWNFYLEFSSSYFKAFIEPFEALILIFFLRAGLGWDRWTHFRPMFLFYTPRKH